MGYSKYPTSLDDGTSLPVSIDYVTPVAAETVNRLRDSILAIESELGTDPSREYGTVADRIDNFAGAIEPGGIATSTSGTFFCPTSVNIGDMVYLASADIVNKANASSVNTGPALGIVISKPASTRATVLHYGQVEGFSGLDPGKPLFLDKTDGNFTNIAPTTTGSILQWVGIAKNTTTIILMVTSDFIEL